MLRRNIPTAERTVTRGGNKAIHKGDAIRERLLTYAQAWTIVPTGLFVGSDAVPSGCRTGEIGHRLDRAKGLTDKRIKYGQ